MKGIQWADVSLDWHLRLFPAHSVAVQTHSFIMHVFSATVARQPAQRPACGGRREGPLTASGSAAVQTKEFRAKNSISRDPRTRKSALWPQEKWRRATNIEVLIIFCRGMVCCHWNNCISCRKVLTNVPFSGFRLSTNSILCAHFSVDFDLSLFHLDGSV